MEAEVFELIEVELKYCERCGGIWLRRMGAESVYCATCAPEMAEFPKPKNRGASPTADDIKVLGEEFGICCAEGHA
jgi:Zn-finger nucleic acid-binding protein